MQKEKVDYKEEHKKTEEQIELHQQQDNSLSLGVKVAAVAVGGVVVGALTAGIGLVPYITVVGLTAVAGGGAVALQYRKPSGYFFHFITIALDFIMMLMLMLIILKIYRFQTNIGMRNYG